MDISRLTEPVQSDSCQLSYPINVASMMEMYSATDKVVMLPGAVVMLPGAVVMLPGLVVMLPGLVVMLPANAVEASATVSNDAQRVDWKRFMSNFSW